MKKILSYSLGICLALLAIAPPIDYSIPMIVNSFTWCYIVIVAGLAGVFILSQKIHVSLKILSIYLFMSCFISQVPYLSFNAYILIALTFYFFLAMQKVEWDIVFNILQAVFWLEVILTGFQLIGKDTLLNFGAAYQPDGTINFEQIKQPVFLGTVMQYMRFGSLLTILSPFLLLKNKLYIIPIAVMCVLSQASNFAISLLAGLFVYFIVSSKNLKSLIIKLSAIGLMTIAYVIYDFGSFQGAIVPSNGGRLISWLAVLKTWCFNDGFNLQWLLFGHGIDTFLPLFPVYKHDINPFPQAHNCWLQFLWEIGLVGFLLIVCYSGRLICLLFRQRQFEILAGLVCISVNMFLAFPTRMTQTALLIIAYAALCEINIKRSN